MGNNHDYLLTNDPEELKATLIQEFPHEKKGLKHFLKQQKNRKGF
ncbi:hypothetical protein [Niabella hibiscisoli]|nr:hypothetical protein [Niabella hibiscisoli]